MVVAAAAAAAAVEPGTKRVVAVVGHTQQRPDDTVVRSQGWSCT